MATTRPIRTALVLGGGSDIGAAIVRRLAADGLEHVVLAARDPDAVARRWTAADLGVRSVAVVAWDALDVEAHVALVADARARLGSIDLVVAAVGLLGHHAGLPMDPLAVDRLLQTNFTGLATALQAVASDLVAQGHGTVVVLSSIAGVRARRSNYVYGSAKAGLDAFAQGLGDALVGSGVVVHVVRPGFVVSSMTTGLPPAPMASSPVEVAEAVAGVVGRRDPRVVWVPRRLGTLMAVLRNVPRPLWRRIAGDR